MTIHGKGRSAELTRAQFLRGTSAAAFGLWSLGAIGCGDSGGDSNAAGGGSPATKAAGGTLLFVSGGFTPQDSLDPLKNISDLVDVVQGMIAEALVTPDFEHVMSPRLAESWQASDDFREWTFKLREGVKFHDGRPLTAEDVAYTLKRHIDVDQGSGLYSRLGPSLKAAGIKPEDDLTLRLQLERPDSLILLPLGQHDAYIVPAGTTGKEYEKGIGTGGFRIKSWTPGRSFEVERNPDYWGEEVLLDGIRGTQVPEASTRAQSVLSGSAHLTELDYSALPTVEGNDAVRIERARGQQFLNVVMDTTRPPFDDPNVRKAIQLAVVRERVKNVAFHDFAEVTTDVPTVPTDPFFPAGLEALLEANVEESKRLLAEAGHPDGLDLTLKVSSVALDSSFALSVADALSESDVRVNVERHPSATYWDEVWLHDDFYVSTWNRRHPVEGMTAMFKSDAAWNESKLKSPELDELLDQALSVEGAELEAVVQEALTIVGDFGGQLIPAIRDRLWLVNSDVVDFKVTQQSLIDLRETALT
jgi:peptide/nickel transport system substrate-binding protein